MANHIKVSKKEFVERYKQKEENRVQAEELINDHKQKLEALKPYRNTHLISELGITEPTFYRYVRNYIDEE